MEQRTCPVCGTQHTRRGIYCSRQCCRRVSNAKARGTTVRPPVARFDCAWCGQTCSPGENVAPHASRFCCRECKARWHDEREAQASRAATRRRRAIAKLEAAARGAGPTGVRIAGPCQNPGCRALFVGVHIDSRYCSPRCHRSVTGRRARISPSGRRARRAWHRRRQALLAGRPEIAWQAVAERDGLACGICGLDVDIHVEVPDDLAPTTDHVVPLGAGGEHNLANVQLAHFICNARKRDLTDPRAIARAVSIA